MLIDFKSQHPMQAAMWAALMMQMAVYRDLVAIKADKKITGVSPDTNCAPGPIGGIRPRCRA